MSDSYADILKLQQRRQRQDDVEQQLIDLHGIAVRLGMYDAADWVARHFNQDSNGCPQSPDGFDHILRQVKGILPSFEKG